jgi:tetratricopeptide (TPR) repeat protein
LSPPGFPAAPGQERLEEAAAARVALDEPQAAIRDANDALAADPSDARALYFRSVARSLLGDYSAAIRDASAGLVVRPADAALLDARAWALLRLRRAREARRDAERALGLDARDAFALSLRGEAFALLGDAEHARRDCLAAAAVDARFGTECEAVAPVAALKSTRRSRTSLPFLPVAISAALGAAVASALIVFARRPQERPGTSLDEGYDVVRSIGVGGMGVVYEAYDRALRRPVAIKALRAVDAMDETAKAEFVAEARTVAALRHPSIVDIHGVVQDDNGVFLVFERLEGVTLEDRLGERGRMPLGEIKRILRPVCEALDYAHAHGVVHRDLKPANVMLTEDGGVKLLDFGIARETRTDASDEGVVGTPGYMAPEQRLGAVRPESDVFSLGALLFEMSTGVRFGTAKTAPSLTASVDGLVKRALSADPSRRPSSAGEFWKALNDAT